MGLEVGGDLFFGLRRPLLLPVAPERLHVRPLRRDPLRGARIRVQVYPSHRSSRFTHASNASFIVRRLGRAAPLSHHRAVGQHFRQPSWPPCRPGTAATRPRWPAARAACAWPSPRPAGTRSAPAGSAVARAAGCTQAHIRSPSTGSGTGTHATFSTAGWAEDQVLDLLRGDLLAAPVDQVLAPPGHHVVAARDAAASGRRSGRSRPGRTSAGCARARCNSPRSVYGPRAHSSPISPSGTSAPSSSTSLTSSSGQIGRPTVSSRTSGGSSSRTNISRPSAIPKFSCTVTLRNTRSARDPRLRLQPLPAALDDAHRTEVEVARPGSLIQLDQQRRHHVNVGDPVAVDGGEHIEAPWSTGQVHGRAGQQETLHAGAGERQVVRDRQHVEEHVAVSARHRPRRRAWS